MLQSKTPTRQTKAAAPSTEMEVKSFHMEVKELNDFQGTFEGYLSVFGNEDQNGDICEPGCFKRSLQAATEVKERTGSAFLFPLLWMHDESNPIGGFTEMKEDKIGLHVKGQCDMNTEQGRRAFSGMRMGYMAQLSIGYNTLRSTRDQKGVRHLLEVRLWEGSAVTTGYAANTAANILQTKQVATASPSVSGKTSWPFADPEVEWNANDAHARLVVWATRDDDTLDESKMRSTHLYSNADDAANPDAYRFPFCDVVGDEVKAIPQGVIEIGDILRSAPISREDKPAVMSKVAILYRRMAKTFEDDTLVPPWQEGKIAVRREIEAKQMGGLQTVTYCLAKVSALCDYIDVMLEMVGDAIGMNLDPDDEEEMGEASSVQPAVQILLDNLSGFSESLASLGTTFQPFDDACDGAMMMLGMEDAGSDYGYMTVEAAVEMKASRVLSASTRRAIKAVVEGLASHGGTLQGLLDNSDKPKAAPSKTVRRRVDVHQHSELSATTADDTNGADSELSATTLPDADADELGMLLLEQQLSAAKHSI